MGNNLKKHNFFSREVPFIIVPILVGTFFFLVHITSLGQWIYKTGDLYFYFQGRSALGFEHKVDPRLKIYVFDDLTTSSIREYDLSAQRWVEILEAISKQNPKAILTPHSFSIIKSLHDPIAFTESIQKLRTKIATGVWLTNKKIHGLLPLAPEDYQSFSLQNYFNLDNPGLNKWNIQLESQIFGPHPGIMNAFSHYGAFWSLSTQIPLVIKVSEEHALSHLALHAADTIFANQNQLYINEISVPMTDDGRIQVNLLDTSSFFEKSRSMIEPIRRVMQSKTFDDELSHGDIVLILPSFSTGQVKYVDTPLGLMPDGYILASVINSLITGNWVHPQKYEWIFMLFMSFLGLSLGKIFNALRAMILVSPIIIFGFLGSLFLFLSFGYTLPIFLGSSSLFFTTLVCVLISRKRLSLRFEEALRIPRYIWGRNGTKLIETGYRNFPDEPTKKIVSIIHVKISNLEKILKNLSGEPLFDELRRYEIEQTRIIHEHGGLEIKSWDGQKLAYFSPDTHEHNNLNHAERAMNCCEELLKVYADILAEKIDQGDFVVKISASVDAASIHVGNFGDVDHLVPVAIGNAVESLFELSSACPPLHIVISKSAHNLLEDDRFKNLKEVSKKVRDEDTSYFHYCPIDHRKEFLQELNQRL